MLFEPHLGAAYAAPNKTRF